MNAPSHDSAEPGIDKQKVIKALDEGAQGGAVLKSAGPLGGEEMARGPSWLTYLRNHSDEVASLTIVAAALVWISGGMLAGHHVPVLVGALLLVPGVLALMRYFRA